MARGVNYRDAVRLLGHHNSAILNALDGLTGGLLLVASASGIGFALNLFDAKSELARLSRSLVTKLDERLSGISRFDRTERLAAAHAVIVFAAYFEVLPTVMPPLAPERLWPAQRNVTGRHGLQLLDADVPTPTPQSPYEDTITALTRFYGHLSGKTIDMVHASDRWETIDEERRAQFDSALMEQVPVLATRRYEELFRQLATDCPEVAFWANLVDHQATRHELRAMTTGLAGVETILAELVEHQVGPRWQALARTYRAALDRPILATGDVPAGLRIPALAAAYVNPQFRVAQTDGANNMSYERWWDDKPVRDDLQGFLIGHFTSPQATRAPLLVLGQPGSGKSLLTQVIAARLSSAAFLVVRVVLREARAEADLQTQIEHAVRAATGEQLAWPELVRAAGNALPVVLLDGFDELLQATGVSQSDYLERVAQFQQREAALGRQVAVLVTSRTAVADRARPAEGMVTVRLEPFEHAQVVRWLAEWNTANSQYFASRRLRPLAVESVQAHAELTRQPLLLLMLALYDADGNALQDDAAILGQAELYERLLTRFAEREVNKTGAALDPGLFAQAVDQELLRLAVVAFTMFNRSRQWATEVELNQDLVALLGPSTGPSGLRATLTAAQVVLGRFFFVHEAKTVQDDDQRRTYEFLHATFGEYLVARLVTRELHDLVDAREAAGTRRRPASIDDSFLYALLSFMPLTMRATTVGFVADRLRWLPETDLTALREVLLTLCHQSLMPRHSTMFTDYQPVRASVPERHAAYSLNLVILLVLVTERLDVACLFPDTADAVVEWQRLTMLWRSQLPQEGWKELIRTFTVDRGWQGDRRTITLRRSRTTDGGGWQRESWQPDVAWIHGSTGDRLERARAYGSYTWIQGSYGYLRKQARFQGIADDDIVIHTLDTLSAELADTIFTFHDYRPAGTPISAASALINLWLATSQGRPDVITAFEMCLHIVQLPLHLTDSWQQDRYRDIVRNLITTYRHLLPPDWVTDVLAALQQ